MTTTVEIPLTPESQQLAVKINGTTYHLTVQWREADAGGWMLDIADSDDVRIVDGLPLVTGADLLAQHGHLNLGFELRVQTDHDPDAVPTFENLGINAHLYAVLP